LKQQNRGKLYQFLRGSCVILDTVKELKEIKFGFQSKYFSKMDVLFG